MLKRVLIFSTLLLILSVYFVPSVQAETVKFTPQVSVPGSDFIEGKPIQTGISSRVYNTSTGKFEIVIANNLIGRYIKAIYNYGIGIAGILAAIIILMSGLFWLTSGGNPDKINNAKSWLSGALIGLLLLLASYTLLKTVNSDLTVFQPIGTSQILPDVVSCCVIPTGYQQGNITISGPDDYKNLNAQDCMNIKGTFYEDKIAAFDLETNKIGCVKK